MTTPDQSMEYFSVLAKVLSEAIYVVQVRRCWLWRVAQLHGQTKWNVLKFRVEFIVNMVLLIASE